MPLLTFSAVPHDEMRLMVKRASDIVAAFAGLIVLSPCMAIVATLVRLTFARTRDLPPGPVRPERPALRALQVPLDVPGSGRSKARPGAPERQVDGFQNAERSPAHRDRPLPAQVLHRRVAAVVERAAGQHVARRSPPRDTEKVERHQRWQRRRLRMRPGLTCLWTLAGRDDLEFEPRMQLDMQYIDSWSLTLDWKILLQTIPRVITGKGAY